MPPLPCLTMGKMWGVLYTIFRLGECRCIEPQLSTVITLSLACSSWVFFLTYRLLYSFPVLPEVTAHIYYSVQILVCFWTKPSKRSVLWTLKARLICQFIKLLLFAKHCSRNWKCSSKLNKTKLIHFLWEINVSLNFFFMHTWSFLKLHIQFEQFP